MSRSISEHQAKVYEYAKSQGERWFTIQEMSTAINLPDASAKNHSTRFEDVGVFERLRISPSHVFRLSPTCRRRHPELIRRLEAALPVFAARRREWLRREAALLDEVPVSVSPPAEPEVEANVRVAPRVRLQSRAPNRTVANDPPAGGRVRKPDQLLALLRRPEGASIDELVAHFGTQPHSIRALISTTTRDRGVKATLEAGRYRIG